MANIDTGFHNPSLELNLLHAVLNQVDYGLAVVNTETEQVLFANAPAQSALQPGSPGNTGLCASNSLLCARKASDAKALRLALQRTQTGQRTLLQLHEAHSADAVAVMPLSTSGYALLAFAKQQMCDTTTVTLFARERGLTSAEGQVLAQVCKGLRPQQIATRHGVQLSTVRTQLRAIRLKTACDSVRTLIEQLSVLPPLAHQISAQFSAPTAPALAVA